MACQRLIGVAALALGLAGCPPPEHTAPPSVLESCTADLSYCDGNVAKVCGSDGYLAQRTVCGETQVCLRGVCEDNVVCQANQRLCVQNELKVCNELGTGWSSERDCETLICANGDCIDPGTSTCPAGASYCLQNTAYQCNATGTGLLTDPLACGSQLCVDGVCLAVMCDPGVADCVGEIAHTCNALGTGYSATETCLAPEHCLMGRCQQVVCAPGTSCDGNELITCNDQGTQITNQRDCAPMICVVNRCVEPDAGQQDSAYTDLARPDATRPDTHLADTHLADANRTDSSRPDAHVADSQRPDAARPDTARPDIVAIDVANQLCRDAGSGDAAPIGQACLVGIGVCEQVGTWQCDPIQQGLFCQADITTPVGIEACGNGLDDNCNGTTDEAKCCPLRAAIDPARQQCRRDERGSMCSACTTSSECGNNFDFCVTVDDGSMPCTTSGSGQGSCPSSDYVCDTLCYWDSDCGAGGICDSALPGFFPGTCSVGICRYTVCGIDCSDNQPCAAGFSCYGIFLTAYDCLSSACPSNACVNQNPSGTADWRCDASDDPCGNGEPCPALTCVEGRCQIGKNCLPEPGATCSSIPDNPGCGAGCGLGASCATNACTPNTACSADSPCALGYKCMGGSCVVAERCLDNTDCAQPSFFCNAGYCDNANPCASDSVCPAGTYCDLASNPAICTPGCRIPGNVGCLAHHTCAADHHCVLNSVVNGGRCDSCSDQDPCIDPETFCNPLTSVCTMYCYTGNSICQTEIDATSECWVLGCTNPDCPG